MILKRWLNRISQHAGLKRDGDHAGCTGTWIDRMHQSEDQRRQGECNPAPQTFLQQPKQHAAQERFFDRGNKQRSHERVDPHGAGDQAGVGPCAHQPQEEQ